MLQFLSGGQSRVNYARIQAESYSLYPSKHYGEVQRNKPGKNPNFTYSGRFFFLRVRACNWRDAHRHCIIVLQGTSTLCSQCNLLVCTHGGHPLHTMLRPTRTPTHDPRAKGIASSASLVTGNCGVTGHLHGVHQIAPQHGQTWPKDIALRSPCS